MNNKSANPIESNITSGENISYWIASTNPIIFKKVEKPLTTDALIVGGGISGITTAYCLLKKGIRVILVEDGYIGSGESGRTTAHITYVLDDRYFEIERIFGRHKAMLAANSHMSALQWIENTIRRERIDCHFKRVPGYLFLHSSDKKETLVKEYEYTKRLGILTEALESVPGVQSLVEKRCIKFPGQGQFHIMKYLKGMTDAIIQLGGQIYTQTKAEKINKHGAFANGHEIKAKHIVVATNTPVNDLVTMHTKQWPYRTYVIAATIKKGKLPYALWWDTGSQDSKWVTAPYHYVRLEEFNDRYDLLIAGGEDHKTGQADSEHIPENERYDRLYEWTKKRFPDIENIEFKWSGQVMEPVDSMAFIGKNPGDDNVYIITGDSGNGMTHGTIAGMLISDQITEKKNIWEELYDPSRKTLKTGGEYLQEVGNMSAQYVDWIRAGDIKDSHQLRAGQGGIMSSGLKKYCVYRDQESNLHVYSAVCPHLGGILQWNPDEKSFDCPLHGSRFTTDGTVINGPAISDLKKMDIKED